MIDAMVKQGCNVGRSFFSVEECKASVEGGFRPPDGVSATHPNACQLGKRSSKKLVCTCVSARRCSHTGLESRSAKRCVRLRCKPVYAASDVRREPLYPARQSHLAAETNLTELLHTCPNPLAGGRVRETVTSPCAEQIDNVLTHELVHAFDHCRAADLDWTDCQHHACSEVSALALVCYQDNV
eukprot:1184559-Prorocentrum_minimum.AAC.4